MTELASEIKQNTRKTILSELKESTETQELPKPSADWDLIWVLSGPEITLNEKGAFARSNEKGRIENGINETRSRLVTGFDIARQVTAKRLGKEIGNVTMDDIIQTGPTIYFNGYNEHNVHFQQTASEGIFESQYQFPREKIKIASEQEDIKHTGHQFEKFPPELLEDKRKIVIVTSARHIPRAKRYLGLDNTPFTSIPSEKIIFYPAFPLQFPLKGTLREINVIPQYQEKGILPPENK